MNLLNLLNITIFIALASAAAIDPRSKAPPLSSPVSLPLSGLEKRYNMCYQMCFDQTSCYGQCDWCDVNRGICVEKKKDDDKHEDKKTKKYKKKHD